MSPIRNYTMLQVVTLTNFKPRSRKQSGKQTTIESTPKTGALATSSKTLPAEVAKRVGPKSAITIGELTTEELKDKIKESLTKMYVHYISPFVCITAHHDDLCVVSLE